ncbi:IDEAL domain-containing protein [Bacillus piscicola]|uniref:IDEAL domain-containing protein n=1 Tax=Bacillus piscicola TaxID=1632684 RepID=UPI001F088AB8|nr:IDEAL domain-containing protein [Bacillus piscicola]
MLHPTHEQHFMKKVKSAKNGRRPSRQVLQSLYAQMTMEYSVFQFNKERLQRMIDEALDQKDPKLFDVLTKEYNALIDEYKDGKTISEQGYEIDLDFKINKKVK